MKLNISIFAKSSRIFNLGFGGFFGACWGALEGCFMVFWAQIDHLFFKNAPNSKNVKIDRRAKRAA